MIEEKHHYRTGTHCYYCKRQYEGSRCLYHTPGKSLVRTKDHIIPKSRKGVNHPTNYVGCCDDCNLMKGKLLLLQFAFHIKSMDDDPYFNDHPLKKFFKIMHNSSMKLYNKTSKMHKKFLKPLNKPIK